MQTACESEPEISIMSAHTQFHSRDSGNKHIKAAVFKKQRLKSGMFGGAGEG